MVETPQERERVDDDCRFVSAKGKKKHQSTNEQIRILYTTVTDIAIVIIIEYFSETVVGVEPPFAGGCLYKTLHCN